MSLETMLLCVIVFLLLVIIVMLAFLWPRKLRDEMDRLGNSLRREMAEQRSDNLKIMKSLRITVEDAVRESVEKELASAPPRSRSRKSSRTKAQAENQDAAIPEPVAAEEEPDNATQLSVLQAMQIPLFPESPAASFAQPESVEAVAEKAAEPETIHMGFVDDIPEVV